MNNKIPASIVTKPIIDAIYTNLTSFKPQINLTSPCPNCGSEALPQLMMTHLFAIGCETVECQHCGKDLPLATDIAAPPIIFSTDPLHELDLQADEFVEIGRKVGLPIAAGRDLSILAETQKVESLPSIQLAKGFYNGVNRPKHILPFNTHFDNLCNLRALELIVESKGELSRKETLESFFRTTPVFAMVYLNPAERNQLKIPSKLVNEWEGLVFSMAYLRRLLARADEILKGSTRTSYSTEELQETLFSDHISIPVGNVSKIHSVDIRRRVVENLGYFLFARFFAARNLTATADRGFTGGYETFKILESIEEAFLAMGFNTNCIFRSTGLVSQEDQPIKNAAIFWMKEGLGKNAQINPKDYRLAPIGKDLSKCFIASTVYGNDSAKDIIVLQRFRDEFLLFHKLGRLFIRIYETISPWLATLVGRNKVLKILAKSLIVKNSVRLARRWVEEEEDRDLSRTNAP